jgi:cytoskeletal protein CcmA (bactofilin family)
MFNPKTANVGSDANAPTNARSFSAHANAGESNCSIINEWLIMRGDLESEGDILVKGKIHGNIQCKLLIIDAEAMIEGAIFADEVVIRGTTRGIIKANRVRLEKTASVDSEIYQATFSAEEGARIKGALRSLEDYAAAVTASAPVANGPEKPAGASLYHLLDEARTAQHAHLAVAQ